MRGLAARERFTREAARRIQERPDQHTVEELREASTWLVLHGDWLDVMRSTELLRSLETSNRPRPVPPRAVFSAAEPTEAQRIAAIHALARTKIARLRSLGARMPRPRRWVVSALGGLVVAGVLAALLRRTFP